MSMQIETKSWKLITKEDGSKLIAGEYEVRAGGAVVAKQAFNDGYASVTVPLSPEVMVEVCKLDKMITEEIKNYYNVGKE